jgi:hypothetical protein
MDITGTANYGNYTAAKATFDGNKTEDNGLEMGRQLCLCIEQAGGDPRALKKIRPASARR